MNFINELATAATGTDCTATAAWLGQAMADGCAAGDPGALALRRAATFWDAADETQQADIGACLGFTEQGDMWNCNKGIALDFERGTAWAYEQVGEPYC